MIAKRLVLCGLVLLLVPASGDAGEKAAKRPNIVFIIADDLGINDLACYGRKDHVTPNLDRLAKKGIRFTNAYSAQSVCSPTRAAIMTGKTPGRLHLTTFLPGRGDAVSQMLLHPTIEQQLPGNVKTLAEMLKAAGYTNACIGKWHLGGKGALPTERGFDLYYPGTAATKPSETEGGKGEYDLTLKAEKFIDDNKAKPFFLYLAHNNPHVALNAKPGLIAKHKDAFNPIYAAMIETLDDCVGRVVAKLESLGLAEDTIIIFTSDNGGVHIFEAGQTPTYNTPYRAGKGFLYEGGVRIPLILAWAGKVKEGRTEETPVISTDWTPTLLGLAGIFSTEKFDGINFGDLVTQRKALSPRPLHWHQPHYMNQGSRPAGAIREGDWKLIEHYETGQCELFNLAKDISETTDLAAKEPGRIADLRGKLEKWRRDIGAQEMRANPSFNAVPWRKIYQELDVSKLAFEPKASEISTRLTPWRATMNAVVPGPMKAPVFSPGGGAIILAGKDAKIHGTKLRFEPQPQKDTIGFWVQKDDWIEWAFDAPKAGTYDVELLQACGKGSGGAELEITVAGQTLTTKVEETGHFQRFIPKTIGTIRIDAPGPQTLTVRAKTKPGGAVMDLRRVVMRAN